MASTDQNQITIDRGYRDNGPAPLYYQYDGQCNAQPAYLEMDEHGSVSVDYSGEIGSGTPASVWHGLTLRWTIPSGLSPAGIDQLLDETRDDLQQIHNGHSQTWDGNNIVGRLTAQAREISEDLNQRLWECEDCDRANIWNAADWISPEWDEIVAKYRRATDKDAYMEELVDIASTDGIVLVEINALEQALQEAE